MRNVLISFAAAASALAFATPASAQYYPQPQGYGYGYDNDYRYNDYGRQSADRWLNQLHSLRGEMQRFVRQGRLTNREVRAQDRNFYVIERALRKYGRNGLNRREAYDMDRRVANLRESIFRSAHDADNRRRYFRDDDRRWRDRD